MNHIGTEEHIEKIKMKHYFLVFFICFSLIGFSKQKSTVSWFDFGSGKTTKGWTPVTPITVYSAEKGFGLIPSGEIKAGISHRKDALKGDH